MSAEATQEKGRKGVARTKRWLEATTYLELLFNAYEDEAMCIVELLDGTKRFDMYGFFLGENRREVFVENKDYSSDSGLYTQFQEFLAVAYSATAKRMQTKPDRKTEFIWVTTHPFKPSRWSMLESPDEMRDALTAHPEVLGGAAVDDDLLRLAASRIWVFVLNPRQIDISLTHAELGLVMPYLKRKEPTL